MSTPFQKIFEAFEVLFEVLLSGTVFVPLFGAFCSFDRLQK